MRRGTSLPLDWHQPPLTLWDAEYADNECTNSHQPSKGMASKATSKDAGQKGMRTSDSGGFKWATRRMPLSKSPQQMWDQTGAMPAQQTRCTPALTAITTATKSTRMAGA